MTFIIKGTSKPCSKEFVRAWLHASQCVLAYHGKLLPETITVHLARHPLDDDEDTLGMWLPSVREIHLVRALKPEPMATTILHEVIHAACGDFGEDTDEKCCSTLTARLKPEVGQLAQLLIDGTYRRAAYFAHTKQSYVADDGDHYDPKQWTRVGTSDRYGKRSA